MYYLIFVSRLDRQHLLPPRFLLHPRDITVNKILIMLSPVSLQGTYTVRISSPPCSFEFNTLATACPIAFAGLFMPQENLSIMARERICSRGFTISAKGLFVNRMLWKTVN
jgi:hypothetical protein